MLQPTLNVCYIQKFPKLKLTICIVAVESSDETPCSTYLINVNLKSCQLEDLLYELNSLILENSPALTWI